MLELVMKCGRRCNAVHCHPLWGFVRTDRFLRAPDNVRVSVIYNRNAVILVLLYTRVRIEVIAHDIHCVR